MWSNRLSSCSCCRVCSRITLSSLPTVDTKYPRAQKFWPTKFLFFSPYTRARWIALLPLINPTTCDTAYLGGIAIIMCTWSGIRCPSSIRLSFCSASLRNTSPRCRRNSPYSTFLRHLGMNTTWYLHSHLVWLRLSPSSIANSLSCALPAHVWESPRWTPVSVKLLLPPRQSRGVSQRTSATAITWNHLVSTDFTKVRNLVRDQVLGPKSEVESWPIRKLGCSGTSCRGTPVPLAGLSGFLRSWHEEA